MCVCVCVSFTSLQHLSIINLRSTASVFLIVRQSDVNLFDLSAKYVNNEIKVNSELLKVDVFALQNTHLCLDIFEQLSYLLLRGM